MIVRENYMGILTANEYQRLSRRTQNENLSTEDKRRHALFGLASEVGEVHSIFQHEYQGASVKKEKVVDECGDLMWFFCELLDTFDLDLEEGLFLPVRDLNELRRAALDGIRREILTPYRRKKPAQQPPEDEPEREEAVVPDAEGTGRDTAAQSAEGTDRETAEAAAEERIFRAGTCVSCLLPFRRS